MVPGKKQQEKVRLHSRNRNRERYDLEALVTVSPELKKYLKPNKFGEKSVDFSNPVVVKLLNQALLNHYYGIKFWEFPDDNLCPPIPGRADYIHYIADLLSENNSGAVPVGDKITCYDIGTGASCIYPLIGTVEYGWKFIASDIDPKSVISAKRIVEYDAIFKKNIECRLQKNAKNVFYGIIGREEKIDVSICNPPFHSSIEDAQKGTSRKVKNLTGKKEKIPELNFSGVSNELICEGGEFKFIRNMIRESKKYAKNCCWFTTLVSKQSNLGGIYKFLNKYEVNQHKTLSMGTGNKISRIVAWTFLTKEEQIQWRKSRW